MLNLNFDLDLEPTLVKHLHCTHYTCAELFVNPTRGTKDIEQTTNTIIQCLTLNFDLELTLVKKYTLHINALYLAFVLSYLQIPTGFRKI